MYSSIIFFLSVLQPTVHPIREDNPWSGAPTVVSTNPQHIVSSNNDNSNSKMSRGEEWLAKLNTEPLITNGSKDGNIQSSNK